MQISYEMVSIAHVHQLAVSLYEDSYERRGTKKE